MNSQKKKISSKEKKVTVKLIKPPTVKNHNWEYVRPDPDQRESEEVYKSEINLKLLYDIELPPYQRRVISVRNNNKLPGNIFGYIHQSAVWQEDNINVENFYIEKNDQEYIKITLTNTSATYTLQLTEGYYYGNLIVRRFRKFDDRFFQKFKDKFRSDVLDKGI